MIRFIKKNPDYNQVGKVMMPEVHVTQNYFAI